MMGFVFVYRRAFGFGGKTDEYSMYAETQSDFTRLNRPIFFFSFLFSESFDPKSETANFGFRENNNRTFGACRNRSPLPIEEPLPSSWCIWYFSFVLILFNNSNSIGDKKST